MARYMHLKLPHDQDPLGMHDVSWVFCWKPELYGRFKVPQTGSQHCIASIAVRVLGCVVGVRV